MGWWVLAAVAVLLALAAYFGWLTSRLGRLHRRAEAAGAALDAALARRTAAVAVLADGLATHDREAGGMLVKTVRAALAAPAAEREGAENDLTWAARQVAGAVAEAPGWPELVTASRRVALARAVHTDAVRDARALRGRAPVRALRLARRLPEPRYFDIDDPTVPE